LLIGLSHEPGLDGLAQGVLIRLSTLFPDARFRPLGPCGVPQAAFDSARGRVDARYLLDVAMPAAPGCDAALWLAATPMGDSWRPWLYGMALPGRAVVSLHGARDPDDAAKLCAHEAGHLLGLEHCPDACVMRVSAHARQMERLPLALCARCAAQVGERPGTRSASPGQSRTPRK